MDDLLLDLSNWDIYHLLNNALLHSFLGDRLFVIIK